MRDHRDPRDHGAAGAHHPRVTVYTTPTCHWCGVAKRELLARGIEFAEVDVSRDRHGLREMVLMTGRRAVPVIRVGTHAMTGWDPHEFDRLWRGGFKHR